MLWRGRSGTYADVVHHHLVETAGAEGTLDDIRDSLCSEDWIDEVCDELLFLK